MKTIDLPPFAPTLMESTRAIGYSLESAVADIIDNSITAKATVIEINFFPIGDPYISILDNGIGMSDIQITSAMQYGSQNPNDQRDCNDLGRYGLGLKTASLSQCKTLTVISVKDGLFSGRRWDLEYVIKTGSWSLLVLEYEDMEKMPDFLRIKDKKNGTLIVWQKLDKLSAGESNFEESLGLKIDRVREHIALVFHRYLAGEAGIKKIEIFINNDKVKYSDPFLMGKSTQVMADESMMVRGEKVVIRPFILPHISKLKESELKELGGKEGLRRQQGFYVYRNKRLLVWGTWFKMRRQADLSKLARIQVDIPNSLDDLWTLDIKKSTAVPPEAVKKNLVKIIEKIADSSKRTWTHRGKKEIDNKTVHLWNRLTTRDSSIIYEINRSHPLVERIQLFGNETKLALETLLHQIEGNLPLNSLYIDLSNDEKVENDITITEKDTISSLKLLLGYCLNRESKVELVDKLKNTEPFSNYLELISIMSESGELYE